MANYKYIQLGPPPKQPRTSKFCPKAGKKGLKIGTAQVVEVKFNSNPRNLELLQKHNVLERVQGSSIKAGEVIIAAKPFIFCPITSARGERCEYCHQKFIKKLEFICKNCHFSSYCNSTCAVLDTFHIESGECDIIKKRGTSPSNDTVRFVLRFLLRLRLDEISSNSDSISLVDYVPAIGQLRSFHDLLDHYDDIVTSNSRLTTVENCYAEIIQFLGEDGAPPPDYFVEVYGRMVINSFNVLDVRDEEGVGSALYIGPSIVDHCCIPNASVSFDLHNGSIAIRALKDMDNFDINNVFISYIDLMDPTKRRQEYLLKHYYFGCQCIRCINPTKYEKEMFSIHCLDCNIKDNSFNNDENSLIFMDSFDKLCNSCSNQVCSKRKERYEHLIEILEEQLYRNNMSFETAQFCKKLMDREHFNEAHIYYLKTAEVLFDQLICDIFEGDLYDDIRTLNEAEHLGKILTKRREIYLRQGQLGHGLILMKLSKVQEKLGKNTEAYQNKEKAFEIAKICLGEKLTDELR